MTKIVTDIDEKRDFLSPRRCVILVIREAVVPMPPQMKSIGNVINQMLEKADVLSCWRP